MQIKIGDVVKTNYHDRKSEDNKPRTVISVYPVKVSQTRVMVKTETSDGKILDIDSAWYTLIRKKPHEYQTNDLSSFMG
jgi:hypothetical protein